MTDFNDEETDFADDEESDGDEENSVLAEEFRTLCNSAKKLIQDKLDIAHQALKEAQEIADQYGVPFHAGISPLSNSYVPKNFPGKSKFAELDSEQICDIAGVWGDYITDMFDSSYGGWVHSAVC